MSEEFQTTTLARLFQTVAFEHEDTRISKKTLQLSAEYLKMFTTEAILRANEDRLNESNFQVDGIDNLEEGEDTSNKDQRLVNDVLDTRHLEHVAGVLVLDF